MYYHSVYKISLWAFDRYKNRDHEQPNGRHYALFNTIRKFSDPTASNLLNQVFCNIWFMGTIQAISTAAELLVVFANLFH